MSQSLRCAALAVLSAAAVSFGMQSASAGWFDGGWGCGCGSYGYAQSYAAPLPYAVFETQTVIRPAYVVTQTSYGYAPEVAYGGWGWRHRYYRHYGWRHNF